MMNTTVENGNSVTAQCFVNHFHYQPRCHNNDPSRPLMTVSFIMISITIRLLHAEGCKQVTSLSVYLQCGFKESPRACVCLSSPTAL